LFKFQDLIRWTVFAVPDRFHQVSSAGMLRPQSLFDLQ
jgi:hypothetical protein